ncbi:2415_t:CDS:2, partial [Gigaspora margarita]
QGAKLARKCELKEKLYSALRSKAKIDDLSKKLLTKYLEQEKELLQSQKALSLVGKLVVTIMSRKLGMEKNILVDEPRPYSKVRLCEEADSIFYFKLAP